MKRLSSILAGLLIILPSPTIASSPEDVLRTGNGFVRHCEEGDDAEVKVYCMIYTIGVSHGARAVAGDFCLPRGVDTGQLFAVGIRVRTQ
jgi:hypothetical protein